MRISFHVSLSVLVRTVIAAVIMVGAPLAADPVPFRVSLVNGDTNGDGGRDVSDAVHLLKFLFGGGPDIAILGCEGVVPGYRNGDSNGDDNVDVSDAVHLLAWLFHGAAAPAPACAGRPGGGARPEAKNFVAPLSGDEEVPPTDSRGRGLAFLKLSDDGTALDYKLIVSHMDEITQAHIHIAPRGVNGPVVVFLFGFVAEGVASNGILAEGTITAANLIPRPAIGFGGTMEELLEAMRTGNAYVNTHTHPFPGGEIRGQVLTAGPGTAGPGPI